MRAPIRSNSKDQSDTHAQQKKMPPRHHQAALEDLSAAALPDRSSVEKPASAQPKPDETQRGPHSPRPFDFNRWYGEFDGYVRMLVRARIRDYHWAEDVTQAVWQKIAVAGHRYDPNRAKEVTFISTITKRVIIDALRRHRYRTKNLESSLEDFDQRPRSSGDSEHSVPEQVSRQELKNIVVSLVHTLPPTRREVLQYIYLRGMTGSSLSRAFDIPSGTVKSRIFRSLRELKQKLSRTRIQE